MPLEAHAHPSTVNVLLPPPFQFNHDQRSLVEYLLLAEVLISFLHDQAASLASNRESLTFPINQRLCLLLWYACCCHAVSPLAMILRDDDPCLLYRAVTARRVR